MLRGAMRAREDRGAAAVEFALIAPLLIFLLFAIIQYGYMLSFRQGISQGAAEGARAAAVAPAGLTSAQKLVLASAAVSDSLNSYGVSCSGGSLVKGGSPVGTCAVTIAACANAATSTCVSVALAYNYQANPLLPALPGLGIVTPNSLSYTAVAQIS